MRGGPPRRRATMLILNLKENEKILIGDKITVMVVEIGEIKFALESRRRLVF